MAKGRKRRRAQKVKPAEVRFKRPTVERTAHNDFQDAGAARKVVPVIQTLKIRGDITQAEYDALNYYRDQASLADRSPTRDSCDFSVRGGTDGYGPSLAIISAKRETSRLEKLLGNLTPICRAVCVDEKSIEAWCCEKYGGVEVFDKDKKTGKPRHPLKVVGMVPRGQMDGQVHIAMERMSLRFSALKIAANTC